MSTLASRCPIVAIAAVVAISGCAPAPTSPTPAHDTLAIALQPQSQTVSAGSSVTLSVEAVGEGSLSYQWYQGPSGTTSQPIETAKASFYTTPALTSTASYWVRVSDATGSVDSATAIVTVEPSQSADDAGSSQPDSSEPTVPESDEPGPETPDSGMPEPDSPDSESPQPESPEPPETPDPPDPPEPAPTAPSIAAHPASQTVTAGETATLVVEATGTDPLSYQWYTGASGQTSSPLPGATAPSYTTPALAETTLYWVRVSNAAGAADSATATITVEEDDSGAALEDQVLSLVNQQRAAGATCGGTPYGPAPALAMNSALRSAARAHSQDMATNDYFSHTSLDGRTFDERIRDAGYSGSSPLGENIAAGYPAPSAVVSAWMSSSGHCANIMSPSFHSIGVGYAFSGESTYGHYWTQDFGGS